jgi:hypothetical protein
VLYTVSLRDLTAIFLASVVPKLYRTPAAKSRGPQYCRNCASDLFRVKDVRISFSTTYRWEQDVKGGAKPGQCGGVKVVQWNVVGL